jgi:hypothetical protein
MQQPTDRQQTIAGLRELADFLEANPDVPTESLTPTGQYSVDVWHPVAERRAIVDQVAAALGEKPTYNGKHYKVVRTFSGGVTYQAVSCKPGPKTGICGLCNDRPVRSPGTDGLAGKLCTPCLDLDGEAGS